MLYARSTTLLCVRYVICDASCPVPLRIHRFAAVRHSRPKECPSASAISSFADRKCKDRRNRKIDRKYAPILFDCGTPRGMVTVCAWTAHLVIALVFVGSMARVWSIPVVLRSFVLVADGLRLRFMR